jgi:hypothetical protein
MYLPWPYSGPSGLPGSIPAVVATEDQREQVSLFAGEWWKVVHHFLDPVLQVVFVVTARGTARAAVAGPYR